MRCNARGKSVAERSTGNIETGLVCVQCTESLFVSSQNGPSTRQAHFMSRQQFVPLLEIKTFQVGGHDNHVAHALLLRRSKHNVVAYLRVSVFIPVRTRYFHFCLLKFSFWILNKNHKMTPNNGLSELKLKIYKRKTKCSCSTSRININKTENCWWQRKGTKARNSLKRMIGSTLEFEYWIRFFGCANSGSRTWELPFVSKKKRVTHPYTLHMVCCILLCFRYVMRHLKTFFKYKRLHFNIIQHRQWYDTIWQFSVCPFVAFELRSLPISV